MDCEHCGGEHPAVEGQIGCVLWRAENGKQITSEDVQWLCYEIDEVQSAYYAVREQLGDLLSGVGERLRKCEEALNGL